jgi:hypothetical protein
MTFKMFTLQFYRGNSLKHINFSIFYHGIIVANVLKETQALYGIMVTSVPAIGVPITCPGADTQAGTRKSPIVLANKLTLVQFGTTAA